MKEKILAIIGVVLIIAGASLNEWVLGSFTTDGNINNSLMLWGIRLYNVAFMTIGAAFILFRKSKYTINLLISAIVMIIFFVILDSAFYLASPWLPQTLVSSLSPNAQLRYYKANLEATSWIYFDNYRRGKPETLVDEYKTDSLGYRNPEGYLSREQSLDVLLIGDSFVWGTEDETIADYLRELLPSDTVYSVGISGNGVPQWRYHYQDYLAATPGYTPPEIVILNFYGGNDINDTRLFLQIAETHEETPAVIYFTYYNYPYLLNLPKLPELFFLANHAYLSLRSPTLPTSMQPGATGTISVPATIDRGTATPEIDKLILDQIDLTVESIRGAKPDTQIILSHIPTSGAIYGNWLADCVECPGIIDQQMADSRLLASHAQTLGIDYVDFTPALREQAKTTAMWSESDHFSAKGYEIYSTLLAEEIGDLASR